MSEKKTIIVNPEDLKISPLFTKKKKNNVSKKIKVKEPKKDTQDKTFKKKLLKFMRDKQEKYDEDKTRRENKETEININDTENQRNGEFKSSVDFFKKICDDNLSSHNKTMKKYEEPRQNTPAFHFHPTENVSLVLPDELLVDDGYKKNDASPKTYVGMTTKPETQNFSINFQPKINIPGVPEYGCLKGGKLPTYRTWRQTQKKHNENKPIIEPNINAISEETNTNDPNQKTEYLKKMMDFVEKNKKPNDIKSHLKKKRTLRTTYKVGKSQKIPKVSVLLSNKTIRRNVLMKSQTLKQTPIQDVKKYLIKNEFIKASSTSPNDVLRKIYESALLICGDVKNHNPDHLLYNYMNKEI